jgi:hypothetical protein
MSVSLEGGKGIEVGGTRFQASGLAMLLIHLVAQKG